MQPSIASSRRQYMFFCIYMLTCLCVLCWLQATFSLPDKLANQPLLYAGYLVLTPTFQNTNSTGIKRVPPISIPYQGFSSQYSNLKITASVSSNSNDEYYSPILADYANALCYAPYSVAADGPGATQDDSAFVPNVCSGGLATDVNTTMNVSLSVLQDSPACSLRITLVPEIPLKW